MIRVTLVKDEWTGWNGQVVPARTQVREFEDIAEAENWFISDSYFSEPYTRSALWERIT